MTHNIQYYSHLILQSKYSFIIKLTIFLSIYLLFYADNLNDLAYCAKKKGAAKAAEAARAAASAETTTAAKNAAAIEAYTRTYATEQLIAEAKEHAIRSTTSKFESLLEAKDMIIQEKEAIIQERDLAIQHKEVDLQNSYRRFFEQRDRADRLEAQVAELKEDLDYLRGKRKHIKEIYSLTQENKQLSEEVQRLTCELQVEKNKIANLRRELAHTKHVLQEDTYGDY